MNMERDTGCGQRDEERRRHTGGWSKLSAYKNAVEKPVIL